MIRACTNGCLRRRNNRPVQVAVASDERAGVAERLVAELRRRGHTVIAHGALAEDAPAGGSAAASRSVQAGCESQWAYASEAAAREVASGSAQLAVVCCWTGTGAAIAANKVAGVRAALCTDAQTAAGARRWNDANALALSLRSTSEAVLEEILDAFLSTPASDAPEDRLNIAHLGEIETQSAAEASSGG
jgi:ribose 5-phosphate isomerase B